jgi:hypothetical protein
VDRAGEILRRSIPAGRVGAHQPCLGARRSEARRRRRDP